MTRRIATIACLAGLLLSSSAALAITVTSDEKAGPESITAAPDGGLILGSGGKPAIYRAARGETQAKPFIDVSADGAVSFLGVYADAATNTLWACEAGPTIAAATPDARPRRPTALRAFDLKSGAAKLRWALPGDANTCNDMSIGPDKALYITDTAASRIYRLKPGATEGELFLENKALFTGIDGITFMDGVMYVTNVSTNNIYRVPMDATGKAGAPVQIWTDQPIKGPDGMRAANGKLFVAENRNGRASVLTVNGETAHVTVLKDGLTQPTAIDPAGDIVWVGDRAHDNATSVPMLH